MAFVSNLASGNFVTPGAFVAQAPPALIVPNGRPSNVVQIVGTATDGPFNQPIYVSTAGQSGAAQIFAAIGAGTALPYSIARAALSASPEATSFVFIRVGDGTQVSATCPLNDVTGAPLVVAISLDAGTNANRFTHRLDLVSGTLSANPVFSYSVTYPYARTQSFTGIGGSGSDGAYSAAALKANLLAFVNGAIANKVGSSSIVLTAGGGTGNPVLATVTSASGGTDGTAGVTPQTLLGAPSVNGGGTGMYVLSTAQGGTGNIVLAGNTDLSVYQNAAAFVGRYGGLVFASLPAGTTLSQQLALKAASNANAGRLVLCADWDYVNDTASGNPNMLVSPEAAIAGIVASLSPWKDATNKPYAPGKLGILGTERTLGTPIDPQGEGAVRTANGIIWLGGMARGGGYLGLPHGLASDGSNISDTRMYDLVASLVLGVLGQAVGEGQTPLPKNGPDLDKVRQTTEDALNSVLRPFLNPADQRLAAASVSRNNTNAAIAQGFMRFDINCTTLAGVKFALGVVAVGVNVQIISADALTFAA